MQLFYNPDISETQNIVSFNKDESRHITKVLRKKKGDNLHITNGKGWLFTSKLISVNPKNCEVEIVEREFKEKRNFKLHIAIAPTKMNDRFEWFLEKATEIGIDEITPIITKNSERKTIKSERFERIIRAAMKQSLQVYKPQLNKLITIDEFLNNNAVGQKFIAHCEEDKKTLLKEALKPNANFIILIGPEGDFTPDEIEAALSKKFIPVSLGETRLRTETAGIVACATVALKNL